MIKKMRTTAFVISILAGVLVLSAVVVIAGNGGGAAVSEAKFGNNSKTLTAHASIYIINNSDFELQATNEGWTGNGTRNSPYIIENYDINANTANGIEIKNTNVYFIIRNCTIHNGGESYDGIYFDNATDGKIDNVSSYNNGIGIWLVSSSKNIIANCAVYNNDEGISLYYSSNNTITNCAVYNNSWLGIYLGILLSSSLNNNIANCTVYNNTYGICLDTSSNNNITKCAIYNNKKGIYMYSSLVGPEAASLNNQITNCAVYNNDQGIYLYTGSSNIQITNCAIYNNSYGISLYYPSNNEIHYCNIYNNTNYGVYSYSYYIINATYNWWGSASGPYHSIANSNGTGDNVSDHVIYMPWLTSRWDIEPPAFTDIQAIPQTQEVYGHVNITCTVTDNIAADIVKVNITGPTGFTPVNTSMTKILSNNNYYYNLTYSIAGEYSYYIWANDTSNNENKSDTKSFTIQVTEAPAPPTNIFIYIGIAIIAAIIVLATACISIKRRKKAPPPEKT